MISRIVPMENILPIVLNRLDGCYLRSGSTVKDDVINSPHLRIIVSSKAPRTMIVSPGLKTGMGLGKSSGPLSLQEIITINKKMDSNNFIINF